MSWLIIPNFYLLLCHLNHRDTEGPPPLFSWFLSIDSLLESLGICFAVLGVKSKTTHGRKELPRAIPQLFLLQSFLSFYVLSHLIS